jgi:hypothetical protein
VRQGYVSLDAARDYYGVLLDPRTLAVDEEGTEAERTAAAPVHRSRVERQKQPVRSLTASELSDKRDEHPPIPCLRISCCGMVSFPFLDEDELRS